MKKIIIRISLMIIVLLSVIAVYFVFIKAEMSSTTKIICKYFENIKADKSNKMIDTTNIKVNDMSTYLDEASIYPIIKYGDSFFQFAGYEIDKEAVYTEKQVDLCYIVDREDIYTEKSITENVYELKNISLKYAFAYKNEDAYYLYVWVNIDGETDIKSKMGNFDELFSEINRDGKIEFYEIDVSIFSRRGDSNSIKSIMCYGDIDGLLDRHIMGRELQNMGYILNGRKTLTYMDKYREYKDAAIYIRGYMQDTKSFVMLSINVEEGYLNLRIPDIWIETCFYIDDYEIERICQDILENFEIYLGSEI